MLYLYVYGFVLLCCFSIIIYFSYKSDIKINAVASIVAIGCLFLTGSWVNERLNLPTGLTDDYVVFIPKNKTSLRLSEDGELSLCIGNVAREWKNTNNGIFSPRKKYIDGRVMNCLSDEMTIEALRQNGASEQVISDFMSIYEIDSD